MPSTVAVTRSPPVKQTAQGLHLHGVHILESRCYSHAFWQTTHSEGRCRQWNAVYYSGGPKAESPFSQGPRPTFVKTLYTLSVLLKPTSPGSLNLAWKVFKGDAARLQPWFIIGRIRWLYIVAYTNGCHKDYKGDWLHRGLLHSFWRWEILVWNLVFISPGGQFGHRYLIPMATRHIVQSSLKVQDGVSFFKMESVRPAPFLPHYFSDWSF